MFFLVRIGDHTLFHQVNHTIRKHFGMYTQVFTMTQRLQYRIGNRANTHLKGTAIFYQLGHLLPDNTIGFRNACSIINLRQCILNFYHRIQFADVDKPIAMRAGHVGINLRNNFFGMLHSRFGYIYGSAQ